MLQEFVTNVKIVKRYTYFEQFAQYFMQMLQPGAYKWRKIVSLISKKWSERFLSSLFRHLIQRQTSIDAGFGISFHY
jgi:hypothetical protein